MTRFEITTERPSCLITLSFDDKIIIVKGKPDNLSVEKLFDGSGNSILSLTITAPVKWTKKRNIFQKIKFYFSRFFKRNFIYG